MEKIPFPSPSSSSSSSSMSASFMNYGTDMGTPLQNPGMYTPNTHYRPVFLQDQQGHMFTGYMPQQDLMTDEKNNNATMNVQDFASMVGVKFNEGSPNTQHLSPQQEDALLSRAMEIESLMSVTAPQPMYGGDHRTWYTMPASLGSRRENTSLTGDFAELRTEHNNQVCISPKLAPLSVGSTTLSPEMLQSMISSNEQNVWRSSSSACTEEDTNGSPYYNKAEKTRGRNRDHSRKSRLRKKLFVENLKTEIKELSIIRDMCDACPDIITFIEVGPQPKILYVSQSFERWLGYQAIQTVEEGRNFLDFVHEEDREMTLTALQDLVSMEQQCDVHFRFVLRGGGIKMANTRCRFADGRIVCCSRLL